MTSSNRNSKMWPVLLAAALIVILAGSLGARLIAGDTESNVRKSPSAAVPAPSTFDVSELEVPCWTCPSNRDWPLRFQTNLDHQNTLLVGCHCRPRHQISRRSVASAMRR